MTHILILTPSLGRVSLGYRDTYARLLLECARRDIKLSVNDVIDPGLLPHARNVLLAAALESDATHAFWWDGDVAFDPSALLDCLDWPEEMICRPYPMRGVDWHSVVEYVRDLPDFARGDEGGWWYLSVERVRNASMLWSVLIDYERGKPAWLLQVTGSAPRRLLRVRHCGFGWVLMRVDALRTAFVVPPEKDWHGRRYHHAFNHVPNEQGILMGEDVSFCALWRSYGRSIWAAPDAVITNGGRSGRFADYLAQHGLLP